MPIPGNNLRDNAFMGRGMPRMNMDLVGDCDEIHISSEHDYLFRMPDDPAVTQPCRVVRIDLPKKLGFLLKCHEYKVIFGGRGGGKCFAVGTEVIMADGSLRAVEHVRRGEHVLGPDSLPRRVVKTHKGRGPLFRVKQTSGDDYTVTDHHLLSLKKSKSAISDTRIQANGNARNPKGRYPGWASTGDIDVEIFAAQSKRFRSHFRGYRAGLLNFPRKKVKLDPYLLGVWLGDGTSRELRITSADEEIIDYCQRTAEHWGGDISLSQKAGQKAYDIGFRIKDGRHNPLWALFKKLDLPNNKHIPTCYLVNTEDTRLRLLAGLIDSDGYAYHNGYQIAQASQTLAQQIKHLADTLGFRTSIKHKKTICTNNGVTGEAWVVYINGDTWRVPCRVARKKFSKETTSKNKDFLLSQVEVVPVEDGDWAGFAIEGDQHFLLADGTVVHNSWAVADALLALGAAQKLRILCAREVQKSLAQSVHQLLKDRIVALGLTSFYDVQDKKIIGANGTLFVFSGLAEHTVDSIKSFEGIDIVWVEEAQSVSAKSWDILIPTIRKDKSEIWITFNPDMDTDPTWKMFVVDPPDDAIVVQINWQDNKNFPDSLNRKRLEAKRKKTKDDYDNIWEGVCRSSVVGAIYGREVGQMLADKRCIIVPYDPRLQVHFIWDLGWNDAMSVVVVQKPTSSYIAVINYFEDSFQRYDEVVERLRGMRYSRWGWHWLPHDGDHKNPQTGMSPRQVLINLRCRVKRCMERTGPEARIKAAREVFPRVMIDSTDRTIEGTTGWLGGARLLECLRRYKRIVRKANNEPATVDHDEHSHGADAFGAMCEIADKIIDDEYVDRGPPVPEFENIGNPGMGTLG